MASSKKWFETTDEVQWRAEERLPRSFCLALLAATERGSTLSDDVAAFDELGWRPHVADLPAERDLTTTVPGHEISMPLLISPVGVQAVHPQGEVAVARAAAADVSEAVLHLVADSGRFITGIQLPVDAGMPTA